MKKNTHEMVRLEGCEMHKECAIESLEARVGDLERAYDSALIESVHLVPRLLHRLVEVYGMLDAVDNN